MVEVNFEGKVRVDSWLGKPVYFTQSTEFDENNATQFVNRKAEIEYCYDVSFEVNRKISNDEYFQMKNALHSVIMMYGDRASEPLFLWERMIHSYTGLINFMEDGDIYINHMYKRYVLGNGDEIAFVSKTEDIAKNQEKIASV